MQRRKTSPAEVLNEEFLIPLGLSIADFVEKLGIGWTVQKVTDILADRQKITEEIASDFSVVFGTTAMFWLGLQNSYDTNGIDLSVGSIKVTAEVSLETLLSIFTAAGYDIDITITLPENSDTTIAKDWECTLSDGLTEDNDW